jgi:cobalamin biosynthesis Mg chelatase CobN
MSFEGQNNWVERQAFRDRILETEAPKVWSAVRSALEDACKSYNEYYGHDPNTQEVTCHLENGSRVVVVRNRAINTDGGIILRNEEVVISFEKATEEIKVARKDKAEKFTISSNETSAFVAHGEKVIDADEISRLILWPLLFPADEKKRPIFRKV